CVHDVQLPPTF
nr:immunoglobulin light chain junction region [Macaca mulatta]MOX24856.1 immunoglobulin light chain junction region [Macaca mulatta]MOX24931.1 immunoglobulin light chain junction region [Macaca mulatta]MOX25273.1 immunoglobulin light chain junction region [Macaca mulatta]MOX26536.1 immunoglobulin light chain junction region [Macaca mulatta]